MRETEVAPGSSSSPKVACVDPLLDSEISMQDSAHDRATPSSTQNGLSLESLQLGEEQPSESNTKMEGSAKSEQTCQTLQHYQTAEEYKEDQSSRDNISGQGQALQVQRNFFQYKSNAVRHSEDSATHELLAQAEHGGSSGNGVAVVGQTSPEDTPDIVMSADPAINIPITPRITQGTSYARDATVTSAQIREPGHSANVNGEAAREDPGSICSFSLPIEHPSDPVAQESSTNMANAPTQAGPLTPPSQAVPSNQNPQPQLSADDSTAALTAALSAQALQQLDAIIAGARALPFHERRARLLVIDIQRRQDSRRLGRPAPLLLCYSCMEFRQASDFPRPGALLCRAHGFTHWMDRNPDHGMVWNPVTELFEPEDWESEDTDSEDTDSEDTDSE